MNMETIFSTEKSLSLSKSIFLAGPTPRNFHLDKNKIVESWRPEALKILKELNFSGTVYVPERNDWSTKFDYIEQIDWELDSLSKSTYIVFWVPRVMETMPALTTNVEFGYWLAKNPEKIIYGRPDSAANISYLDYLYSINNSRKIFNDLKDMLKEVNELIGV